VPRRALRRRLENPKPNEFDAEGDAAESLSVGVAADEEPEAGTLAEPEASDAVAVAPFNITVVGLAAVLFVGEAPKTFVAKLPVGVRLPEEAPKGFEEAESVAEGSEDEPKGLVALGAGLDPVAKGSLEAEPVAEGLAEEPKGSDPVAVGLAAEPVPAGAVT